MIYLIVSFQAYRRPINPFAHPSPVLLPNRSIFHITYKRFVSIHISLSAPHPLIFDKKKYSTVVVEKVLLTQRVAAAQLRLLRVFGFQLVADAVK